MDYSTFKQWVQLTPEVQSLQVCGLTDAAHNLWAQNQLRVPVVVVNFWPTWCGPCREELPELVKFADKFRGKGVVVLTVSLDDAESLNVVKKFLTDYKVNLTNFLLDFSDSDMDAFINSIDAKWSGALPATFVYGKNGDRTQKIIGGATEKHFERLVKPLL